MKRGYQGYKSPSHRVIALAILLLAAASCGTDVQLPKPRAYPKIDFPSKQYVRFDNEVCDFTFEMPAYATVEKDSFSLSEEATDPCWFDLYYPQFECRIHCSYYPVSDDAPLEKLNSDAFRLAMEHSKKASFIDEIAISKPNGVSGFIFNLEGQVATPFQFYLTDSTQHFLRGALYFRTQIRPDSLAPLYEFVKQDISHLINTFEWKGKVDVSSPSG